MKKITPKGFAHLGILLILVVVVAVALIGYKVAKSHKASPAPLANTSIATTPVNNNLPVIKNVGDLNTVESTLNSQNIDGDLNPDSLNQDVQSLL